MRRGCSDMVSWPGPVVAMPAPIAFQPMTGGEVVGAPPPGSGTDKIAERPSSFATVNRSRCAVQRCVGRVLLSVPSGLSAPRVNLRFGSAQDRGRAGTKPVCMSHYAPVVGRPLHLLISMFAAQHNRS